MSLDAELWSAGLYIMDGIRQKYDVALILKSLEALYLSK